MTLDIQKYLKNLIQKEAKISHFQVTVDAGKASKLKGQFASAIKAEFGDNYLLDADYVLFFEKSEPWAADDIKKLFELTNRALGKDANMLSKSDFQALPAAETAEEAPEDQVEPDSAEEVQAPAANILFLKITLK